MKNKYFYLLLLGSLVIAACSQSRRDQTSATEDHIIADDAKDNPSPNSVENSAAKLVKTADMRFKVQNVQKANTDISNLAHSMNGMLMDHTMESSIENSEITPISNDSMMVISSYITHSDMTVRVPSERMEEFLNAVGKLAAFINFRHMHIDDKRLDYLAAKMKSMNRSQFVKDQQKRTRANIEDGTEVLNVKDELIDHNINNMKIDDSVKYSTINLNLYQNSVVSKEVTVNNNLSNYQLPFFMRVGNAFTDGCILFKDFLIALTHIWIFIGLGIFIWITIKYRVKKSKLASK